MAELNRRDILGAVAATAAGLMTGAAALSGDNITSVAAGDNSHFVNGTVGANNVLLSAVKQGSLPRLINVTGLVKGQTRLSDELLLLYSRPTVMGSALAGMLSWIWNGTSFVPPAPPSTV